MLLDLYKLEDLTPREEFEAQTHLTEQLEREDLGISKRQSNTERGPSPWGDILHAALGWVLAARRRE